MAETFKSTGKRGGTASVKTGSVNTSAPRKNETAKSAGKPTSQARLYSQAAESLPTTQRLYQQAMQEQDRQQSMKTMAQVIEEQRARRHEEVAPWERVYSQDQDGGSGAGLYAQAAASLPTTQKLYAQAMEQQGGPSPRQVIQQEQGGIYSQAIRQMQEREAARRTDPQTLEDVRAALPKREEQYETAKSDYWSTLERNIAAAAQDPYSVSPEQAAEVWQLMAQRDEASQRYEELLGRNEQLSYAARMENTRTDLSSVADIQRQKDGWIAESQAQMAAGDTEGAAEFRRKADAAEQRLEQVRQSLRAEGYTDGEINSLFAKLERDRNAEVTAQRFAERRAAAAERGTAGNLAINVGAALASGVGYLDVLGQKVFNGKDEITGEKTRLDYNTGGQDFYYAAEATMQGQMDKLLEKYGEVDEEGNRSLSKKGRIAAGAYQLTASMGQSAAVVGLTAMGVPAATLLLSGSAATSTAHEMHEAGFSDGAALTMGAISGAAEYVTEKIGIDELFKLRDARTAKNVLTTVLKNFSRQAAAEGGEEVLSTVINTIADLIVNGDKNALERRYRELLAQGMSQQEAQRITQKEWLQGAWQDFYMGAISGGLFAGGGMAFQSMRNGIVDTRTGRQIMSAGQTQALLDMVNDLDAEISQAANVPAVSEQSSARELGAAYQGLERAQAMENIRQELAARGEENASPALLSGMYATAQDQRLTGKEEKAIQKNRTAMEIIAEWRAKNGGAVPVPFQGVEEVLRRQLEAKKTESENVFREEQQEQRKTVIPYEDVAARTEAQNDLHQKMVRDGTIVDVSDSVQANEEFYPDLRQMKRRDRTTILKEKASELKGILRGYLNELKGVKYDFDINGSTVEARLYNTGINEVLEKLTQEKAGMLGNSDRIFRSAQYLYSTADKTGNPNISGWDYFYCPIKIGDDVLGVRIAVRNLMADEGPERQIYNWGIKKGDTDKAASQAKEAPQTSVSPAKNDHSNPRLLGASEDSIRPSAEKSNKNFEGEGRASAEVADRRTLEREYKVIDHSDTAQIEQRMSDAYEQAVEENRGVTIDSDTLAKYESIANDPTQSLVEAVKDYYDHTLKGTTVDVQMDGGVLTIMFENDGKRKSVGWRMKPDKAATFEALHQLTENAVYAYSEQNRNANERTSIPYFHYFVNNVDLGGGKNIPVKIQTRDIIGGNAPGTHYYTHTLLNSKARNTGPVSEAESPRIDSNAIGASRSTSIPESAEKSNRNFEGEGRASAEVTPERAESQRVAYNISKELAEGRGIDIMPGEGEEAISSTIGLTEEDNAALARRSSIFSPPEGIDISPLFGPTNAQKEARATETATRKGNEALREFIEDLPDDPMDLYQEQNPVNAEKSDGREKISTEKKAEKKSAKEKTSEAWHRFIRGMVNEGDAIHQAALKTGNKALDGMYFYAKAGTQRAQQWIQKKRMSFDLSQSGKGLNEIFDPIRAKGKEYYESFELYMYHMLNVERMSRSTEDAVRVAKETLNQLTAADNTLGSMSDEELRRRARQYEEGGGLGFEDERGELIHEYWTAKQELYRAERAQNKPVFGFDTEFDADASRRVAGDILAAHPEFEELAKDVYDYTDALLQYRVDAGLITREDMAKLKATYPHYVPVMYATEDSGKVRKGNVQVSSTVKSAEGGDGKLEALHLALARQTLAVMKNAGYQQLGAEVLSEYENNRELMGRYVEKLEESEAVWDESLADNDDVIEPHENVVSVLRDGKRFDLTMSEDMSAAFKSLQPSRKAAMEFKLLQKANNLFKKLCTAYNPLFMITNPVRDIQDALFYSTDTKRWMKNYPKAWAQIAGSGKYWQMYQAMGGVSNTYFDWATGERVKGNKLARGIEAANLAIEQAPRLAEFMTVLENAQRKNGEITQSDRMEAFNAAAEITTNFGRSGTMGQWINRNAVPFWNPGVQGLSKAVRTVSETRSFKAWANLALKTAALGMVPALLNGLLYRDDDEWDKINDQMKMEYYLFKTKDGVWIKIPRGRMLAALSMPVVGAQETLRGDDVDWGDLAKQAFGSVAPNNPIETNLLSQALRAKLFDADDPGKTWYGGDIESKRLQSYAPGQRYDESTDVISKWLGGKLNISPKKINYILDQYSGVLGDLILPYLTPKAERGISMELAGHDVSVPLSNAFMSRFTLDTVTNNTISKEYYGLLDELGYAAKGGDKPSAIAERYMNRAGSTVSDIYAQIRKIENDKELSDREKTQLTRELRKKLNEFETQVTEKAKEYLEAARQYMDEHVEFDYTDEKAVDAFTEGYNSVQTSEKYMIDTDQAAGKMKDEVYREVNRRQFGAEYALQVYNKDVYEKARGVHDESGLSYDDYYDYYFGTRYLFADKDEDGQSISGSKKEKVVAYIDGMEVSDEQKDALYLAAGYTENSLDTAPWNGGSGVYTKGGKKKSGGGRGRRRSGSKKAAKEPAAAKIQIPKTRTGSAGGSGGAAGSAARSGSGKAAAPGGSADASLSLIQIIDRYYGGNALAAAADGGRKARQARTEVDFKL